MKEKLTGIGLAALKGCAEILLVMPVLLIIHVYMLAPIISLWFWLAFFPLLYAAGFSVNTFFLLNRWGQLMGGVTVVAFLGAYLLAGHSSPFFPAFTFACVAVYRGALMAKRGWSQMLPVTYYGMGMLSYLIASVILQFIPSFSPYTGKLTGFGLLALAMTLIMVNQSMMKQETLSGDKEAVVAAVVVRQNRALIILVLMLIVLIVFFRKLQALLLALKETLLAWLREWLQQPREPLQVHQEAAAPQPPMGLGEAGPPAFWVQWLEKAVMAVVSLALVLGVMLLLYMAAKKLPSLYKRLSEWIIRLFNQRGERQKASGYVDDVESLMNWQGINSNLTGKVRKWLSEQLEQQPRWQAMDNRERVRYLYKQWIRKHAKEGYQPQKHLTPMETSEDISRWNKESSSPQEASLIRIYEQTRYSEKSPAAAEVDALKVLLNRNNK